MLKRLMLLMLGLWVLFPSTLDAQTWPHGKQLLIWPNQDSLAIGDTLILNGYARTSSARPVLNPLLRWSVVFDSTATVLFTGKDIGIISHRTTNHATVFLRWQTNSGLFVDTLRIRFIPKPTPLPWRLGQQALLVVSDTVIRGGDTLWYQAYARTSSGRIITSPSFMYIFTDYGLVSTGGQQNNAGYLVFHDIIRNNLNSFGIAWTTQSGIFRDSVVIRTIGPSDTLSIPPITTPP